MNARTNKVTLHERWREKIRVSMIINRLQACAMGRIEMSPAAIKSADILLKRCLPELQAIHIDSVNRTDPVTIEYDSNPLISDALRHILSKHPEPTPDVIEHKPDGDRGDLE